MSPRERDEHPLDYDHEDDDIRRLAGIIERQALRTTYDEGGGIRFDFAAQLKRVSK